MRYLFALILILALAAGGAYVVAGRPAGLQSRLTSLKSSSAPVPRSKWPSARPARNLKSVKVVFDQNGKQTTLYEMANGQPSGEGVKLDGADKLRITRTVGKQEVPDLKSGPARITVTASRVVLRGLRTLQSTRQPRRAGPARTPAGLDRLDEALHQSRRIGDGRLSRDTGRRHVRRARRRNRVSGISRFAARRRSKA